MYNFSKVKNIDDSIKEFKHPMFLPGEPDLVKKISRQNPYKKKKQTVTNDKLNKLTNLYDLDKHSETHLLQTEKTLMSLLDFNENDEETKLIIRSLLVYKLSAKNGGHANPQVQKLINEKTFEYIGSINDIIHQSTVSGCESNFDSTTDTNSDSCNEHQNVHQNEEEEINMNNSNYNYIDKMHENIYLDNDEMNSMLCDKCEHVNNYDIYFDMNAPEGFSNYGIELNQRQISRGG